MNKFFWAHAHITNWHSFTAPALLCYRLSGSEAEGECVCLCVSVCVYVWLQIYMRESPLGICCSNEIQSQIRDEQMRQLRFKSPFLAQPANSRKDQIP